VQQGNTETIDGLISALFTERYPIFGSILILMFLFTVTSIHITKLAQGYYEFTAIV